MATSHFTQTGTTQTRVTSHEGENGNPDPLREKGMGIFSAMGNVFTAIPGVRGLLGNRPEKTNAVNTASVYHQKPRRVLENPFNQEYLNRLSQDDSETAQHFYAYFTKLLIVQLRFKLRSPSLAEDAAQETLLRVLLAVRRGEIQFPDRLPGFVRSVSENVAREITRKNTRFQQIPENNPEAIAHVVSAEVNCITEEGKEKLLRVLQKINEKDRALLVNIYIHEQDKEAICATLGVDRGSLRVRQFRALARLRKAMEEDTEASMAKKAVAV